MKPRREQILPWNGSERVEQHAKFVSVRDSEGLKESPSTGVERLSAVAPHKKARLDQERHLKPRFWAMGTREVMPEVRTPCPDLTAHWRTAEKSCSLVGCSQTLSANWSCGESARLSGP